MTDGNKLKPCPFCGGEEIAVQRMTDGGFAVFCMDVEDPEYRNDACCSLGNISYGDHHTGAGANEGNFASKEAATRAWNSRQTESPVVTDEMAFCALDDYTNAKNDGLSGRNAMKAALEAALAANNKEN